MKHIIYLMTVLLMACSISTGDENSISITDYHRDLNQTNPLDFLLSLKKPQGSMTTITEILYDRDQYNFIMCSPIDSNWIKESDIALILPYLDSNNVISQPVFSTIASITTQNHGYSTLANEAYYLILGYRYGRYPPYSTIPLGGDRFDTFRLADSSKNEIITWWNTVKQ